MFSRRQLTAGALATLAMPQMSRFAQAQDGPYPSRAMRSICMFPPGSGADISVRFFANKLSKLTGQSVIVENKPGASGNIATETVVRARPDGYTFYIAPGSSVLAPAPHIFRKLNYDPLTDLEHVTTIYTTQFLLCVDAKSPFRSIDELVAHLKQQGDKASYASTANTGFVSSEVFKAHYGLNTVEVKYKTSAAAVNDMTSGNLVFGHYDFRGNAAAIRSGRIRALATSGSTRMKAMPDVPSAKEIGLKHHIDAWWSLHVPTKTPEPIIAKLEQWMNQIVADAETNTFLTSTGAEPLPGNRKLVRQMLERDIKAWAEYVKIAKIQPL